MYLSNAWKKNSVLCLTNICYFMFYSLLKISVLIVEIRHFQAPIVILCYHKIIVCTCCATILPHIWKTQSQPPKIIHDHFPAKLCFVYCLVRT